MRAMAAAVLVFEAIVLALAIPVAINVGGADWRLALSVGLALVAAAIVVAASTRRPWGINAGWAVQAAMFAVGIIVPSMLLLAVLFAGLYYAALRMGRTVDEAKARQAQEETT